MAEAQPQHKPQPGPERAPSPAEADAPEQGPVAGEALASDLERVDEASRTSALLSMQQTRGNGFVQRVVATRLAGRLAQRVAQPVLQRQTPAPAPGVSPPPAAGPAPATLPRFTTHFVFGGPDFDADFNPVAPAPAVTPYVITHRIFIDFKPFDEVRNQEPYKNMRLTKAQKKDSQWTEAEKTKFFADFASSVQKGWSGKHNLRLKDPTFSEYIAAVQVKIEQAASADKAHTKIKALKIPKDLPRFRSFVSGGEATLDIRDVTETEKRKVRDRQLVRQIRPFGWDNADTAPVEGQIAGIAAEMKKMMVAGADPKKPLGADWNIFFQGRASEKGSESHNKKLGQQRADAVQKRINDLNGWSGVGNALSKGEENASDSDEFQRVDVAVTSVGTREVEQNTAAHEFGHMIGLDDEYTEEGAKDRDSKKFVGDESEHYQKIKNLMGEQAANETLRQDSGSIMSVGGEVKKGHYVFFLEALNKMTGKSWTVG